MKTRTKALRPFVLFIAFSCVPFAAFAQTTPGGPAIDGEVNKIMTETHSNGMAVAVVDHGKVGYVHAYSR
jgi:CubicO group peptidase (beta-lactamase class C family)